VTYEGMCMDDRQQVWNWQGVILVWYDSYSGSMKPFMCEHSLAALWNVEAERNV
jgi:hypothetical protein